MSNAENLRNFKNFSENLKKTSLGIKFGRKLFTDPQSLDAKTIIAVMRALGLNVPRELIITADVAQCIASGGALYSAYEQGKNYQEIAGLSAASLGSAVTLGKDLGWISDEDGSVSNTATLLGSTAMLIATGGLDVNSWLALGMAYYSTNLVNEAMAMQMAAVGANKDIKNLLTNQQKLFGNIFSQFATGKISILQMLSKSLLETPEYFNNSLKDNPQFKKLFGEMNLDVFPQGVYTTTHSASVSDTFMGMGSFNEQTESYSVSIPTTAHFVGGKDANGKYYTPEEQVRLYIFYNMIWPHLYAYDEAYKYYSKGLVSLETLAISTGLGSTLNYIHPDASCENIYKETYLSPYEYGDDQTIQAWADEQKPMTDNIFKDVGVDFFGVKTQIQKTVPKNFVYKNRSAIKNADKTGNVMALYSRDEIVSRLKYATTFPKLPFETGEGFYRWRFIKNYVATLQYVDLVLTDPLFFNFENNDLKRFAFMGNMQQFMDKASRLFDTMLLRKMNTMARGNVAYFLNTKPSKLIKKNEGETGAGIFSTK